MSETVRDDVETSGNSSAVESVEVASYRPRQTFGQLLRNDLGFLPVLLTLLLVIVFFEIVSGGIYLGGENFSNLITQSVKIGIIGLGLVLVLLIGEIDLSASAVSVFSATVMAVLSERMGWSGPAAILVGILAGALAGFINGVAVAVIRVPAFIVTLAASIFYSGVLLMSLGGQSAIAVSNDFILSIAGNPTSYLTDFWGIFLPTIAVLLYILSLVLSYVTRRKHGLHTISLTHLIVQSVLSFLLVEGSVILFESYHGVPYSATILFALITLLWIVLTKTRLGRHVYAVGGNAEAARRAGINVVGIRIAVFTACSMLAAVAGVIVASRSNAVNSQVDSSLLLDAIAAAVIGGVSLFGGRGSVWSVVLGMLIIGGLENGLALKSEPTYVNQILEGLVLVLAVAADAIVRRFQARSRSGR